MPEFLVFHDHKYCLSFLLVSAYSITVNWYRLTLMGNGGWYGGPEQPKTLISAVYDANGKMLHCVVSPAGTDQQPCTVSMRYTGDALPTVKAFAQQSGYTPLAGSIVMDLSKMQPSGVR